jgi:Tol biopolymer transport system component
MAFASSARAQVTQRVNVSSEGQQANDVMAPYSYASAISADGRFVAFYSLASNLVPEDTNGVRDAFVRDRREGVTERVSVDSSGAQANGPCPLAWYHAVGISLSATGRFVVFESEATNLVPGDTNGKADIFVRDRESGTTERISVDSNGGQGDGDSYLASSNCISADGRYVVFVSFASNLVPGDGNRMWDVFVRDRRLQTTERVSVSSLGFEGDFGGGYEGASIPADGRYVAFASWSTNLVSGDTNGVSDIFVRDLRAGTTERASVTTGGSQVWDYSEFPSISADGRFVAFESYGWDWNDQVMVRDRLAGTTEMESVSPLGQPGNWDSYCPSISADGRYVAFVSISRNLVPRDPNGASDVFVRDRLMHSTENDSVDSYDAPGNLTSFVPSISSNGRFVVFISESSNLVPNDTNGFSDVFVRDRTHGEFPILCEPGITGVINCPCSNGPYWPNRGCDNSAATGGASLAVHGGEYLSSDSIEFATSDELPTALSLLLEGTRVDPSGSIYGQGVRCVGGTTTRLYTRAASNGSITVPDFAAGDPSVHERSAALGDPISAGTTRWYMVAYRDPVVLGGCPASSTFNSTQTRAITWSP